LHRFCLIHPCDRQTDGRTDRQTELRWLRRAIAVPAVARKNDNYGPKIDKNCAKIALFLYFFVRVCKASDPQNN